MENSDIWKVQFSALASEQLVGIFQYLLDNGEVEFARELVKLIRTEGDERLKTLPYRGRVVPELETLTKEYREIRVKNYRLVYRPIEERRMVRILVIAHVRQEIQDILLNIVLG